MPLRRFLVIALLVFPLTAFGQSQRIDPASTIQHAPDARTASEPWRVLPGDGAKLVSPKDQPGPFETSPAEAVHAQPQVTTLAAPNINDFVASPGGTPLDSYCLKIRSYVVARDSKQSDSTHLVRYSTCQPASRYRLKTIPLQADPPPSR
jgi:hypothetical protein